jgi:hypothetical protein
MCQEEKRKELARQIKVFGEKLWPSLPPWESKAHGELCTEFAKFAGLESSPSFDKRRYPKGVELIANIQPDLELATVRGMHSFRRYWGDVSRFPGMQCVTKWARMVEDNESLNKAGIPSPVVYCEAVTAELEIDEPGVKDRWDNRTDEEFKAAFRPREDLISFFRDHLGFSVKWFPEWSWIAPDKKGVLLIKTNKPFAVQDKIEINRRQAWRNPAKTITYFL